MGAVCRTVSGSIALVLACQSWSGAAAAQARSLHVPYEATPHAVVGAMLRMAEVGPDDVVMDVGCGDGRFVIAAARGLGARAICVDRDPRRLEQARARAQAAGVAERIRFVAADAEDTDFREATVVTLFLSAPLNARIAPRLRATLPVGARVVSHWHDMGAWRPERTEYVYSTGHTRPVHLWRIGSGR